MSLLGLNVSSVYSNFQDHHDLLRTPLHRPLLPLPRFRMDFLTRLHNPYVSFQPGRPGGDGRSFLGSPPWTLPCRWVWRERVSPTGCSVLPSHEKRPSIRCWGRDLLLEDRDRSEKISIKWEEISMGSAGTDPQHVTWTWGTVDFQRLASELLRGIF